jgi:arsenate reductase-like glutaredoxin family protein
MRELLERLIDDADPQQYLNPRSPAYKERDLGSRKLTKAQVIDLMMEDPNLIRRPIVVRGPKKGIFGFAPDEYDDLA